MKHIHIIMLVVLGLTTTLSAQTISLDSCKTLALENNKRLKEVRLNVKASEQVKKNAFTNYFPKVDAGVFAMKANKGLIEFETPEMNLPVYDGNLANLPNATQFAYIPGMNLDLLDYSNIGYITAVQPIFTGGRIINGNKLATLGMDVSELMLDMTQDEVIQNIESYYWTIVALKEKVNTLNKYKKLLHNLLNDVTVSYEAGLIQKSDMLKVKMKLNEIEANKLKLENGISLLKMTLSQHLGIPYNNSFTISDSVEDIVDPQMLYQNHQKSLLNRTEYKLLNKAIEAEELQKKMVLGEQLPHVAIGAQALYLDVMENQSTKGLAFVSVSIPISNWWGGSHKLKEHQLKIDIAQNNLDEKSELLVLQMNKAYNDLNESFMQIKVAKSSKEQAIEHLSVVQDNYSAGILSTSDFLEAQAMMQQSQDAVVDAQTTYKIKQAHYLQVVAQNR